MNWVSCRAQARWNSSRRTYKMTLFCSAREFYSLCREIADKAEIVRLQAKGGSMYPFIHSGDWVELALLKGREQSIRKGDIILFRKGESLYLHRVLRRSSKGFIVKGDMSYGSDGLIPPADVLAIAVSVEGKRRVNLRTGKNRLIAAIAAEFSIILQYPILAARKLCGCGAAVFSLLQGLRIYRLAARKIFNPAVTASEAGLQDVEQLRDLYLMSGVDIRDGLARIKDMGSWLVCRAGRRIAGGITVTRDEQDPVRWFISGLEIKQVYRGLGIGRALVKAAVARARKSGAERIGLLVNRTAKPALGLYRSLGFKAGEPPQGLNRSADELYLSYSIAGDSSHWHEVLEEAVRDGMFYPVYNELSSNGILTRMPEGLREKFRQMYYLHLSKSAESTRQLELVLGRLESLHISVLLFKGPATDAFIYDGFFRPRLDLDIAVREEDTVSLEKALLGMGYSESRRGNDYPLPEYLNSRLFTDTSGGLMPVHVHKRLINNMFLTVDNAFSVDMRKVWEETEPFRDHRSVYMLKPEMNIIYLCDHGLKHDFDQPVYLYEIKQLIGYYRNRLDWKKFVAVSAELGLNRVSYYGLYFARRLQSADVPAGVLDELKPERFTAWEKSFIRDTLAGRRRRYAAFPVYLALRAGLLKKARFICRTLFPPEFSPGDILARMRRIIPG